MIKNFKKTCYIAMGFLLTLAYDIPYWSALNQRDIDPEWASIIVNPWRWLTTIETFLIFIRNFLFNILWIVAVGAFIYVWYLFVTARGKPDEFKKAWTHVIYIIVGILLVSAAWWIVSLVAWIDL